MGTTRDIRPRRRQLTESEGGAPKPHAPVRVAQHPAEELARISVPTTLIWGRHDRQTPLAVAQQASTRFGWPLHVIEDAADDPAFEQPAAVLRGAFVALAPAQ